MPSRWRMPSEYWPTRRFAAAALQARPGRAARGDPRRSYARGPARRRRSVSRPLRPACCADGVEQHADARARGWAGRGTAGRATVAAPGGRRGEPADHPQGGGLAGAVGPEEAGDGAGLADERDVVDGELRAVALGEVVDGDHGLQPDRRRPVERLSADRAMAYRPRSMPMPTLVDCCSRVRVPRLAAWTRSSNTRACSRPCSCRERPRRQADDPRLGRRLAVLPDRPGASALLVYADAARPHRPARVVRRARRPGRRRGLLRRCGCAGAGRSAWPLVLTLLSIVFSAVGGAAAIALFTVAVHGRFAGPRRSPCSGRCSQPLYIAIYSEQQRSVPGRAGALLARHRRGARVGHVRAVAAPARAVVARPCRAGRGRAAAAGRAGAAGRARADRARDARRARAPDLPARRCTRARWSSGPTRRPRRSRARRG